MYSSEFVVHEVDKITEVSKVEGFTDNANRS